MHVCRLDAHWVVLKLVLVEFVCQRAIMLAPELLADYLVFVQLRVI